MPVPNMPIKHGDRLNLLYDLYRIIFIGLSQIRHYKIEHVVLDAIDASAASASHAHDRFRTPAQPFQWLPDAIRFCSSCSEIPND